MRVAAVVVAGRLTYAEAMTRGMVPVELVEGDGPDDGAPAAPARGPADARNGSAGATTVARAGVRPLRGKNVVELPVLDADKGSAVLALRAELGAAAVVYAGDDVTDEHAFAVLGDGDVTVKVGPGETVATFRVPDATALVAALEHLLPH